MNKSKLTGALNGIKRFASKNGPGILTGIGIAGMITTTVLAVNATPKALKLIEDKKKEEKVDKLTPVETVKACWKPYIPAVVTGVGSVACLIGATSVNAKRNAALATAYKLSETALSEYKDKVVEVIGDEKEKEVREKLSEDRIKSHPVNSETIKTGNGDDLFFDPLTGRYFESAIEDINRAVNKLNKEMIHDMFGYCSLNEFYSEIGLDMTELGEDLGWNLDAGMIEIDFHSKVTEKGKPCIVLYYVDAPVYNYSKFG